MRRVDVVARATCPGRRRRGAPGASIRAIAARRGRRAGARVLLEAERGGGSVAPRRSSHGAIRRWSWLPATSTTSASGRAPRRAPRAPAAPRRAPRAAGPWRSSSVSPSRTRRSTPSRRSSSASRAAGAAQDVDAGRARRGAGRRRRGCARGRAGYAARAVPARPGRHARRRLLPRARRAALHDDARRPRRRRGEGRAPRRRRRHARVGPAVASTRARRTTSGSTATSARSRSTSRTPATSRWPSASRPAPTSSSSRSGPGTIDRLGLGYDDGARGEPGRRLLLDQRVRLGRARRRAARLRPPAAGDERAHVGHGRARRAAAEGRRRAHRHDLRALRRQRACSRRCTRARGRARASASRSRSWTARSRRCSTRAPAFLNAGVVPGRLGNRHPSITPYETFRAADGDFAVACGNDALFRRLCAAIGRPELAERRRFADNRARLEHRDALDAPTSRPRSPRRTPPSGSRASGRRASRPGRSTTSARRSRSPRSSGSSRGSRSTGSGPCARR